MDFLTDFLIKNFSYLANGILVVVAFLGYHKDAIKTRLKRRRAERLSRREQQRLGNIMDDEDTSDYLRVMEDGARAKLEMGKPAAIAEIRELSKRIDLNPSTIRILRDTLASEDPSNPVFMDVLELLCRHGLPNNRN